jgi:hypothetical protein
MVITEYFSPRARNLCAAIAVALAGSALAGNAQAAGAPVAIVEEVGIGVTQVEPMDLLSEGDRFDLKSGQTVIIGYFSTCMREVVRGGKIVVGKSGSQVDGGEAVAKKMKCAAGTMDLTPEQLAQSAALAYRDPSSPDPLEPQTIIGSTQPVIVAPGLKEVVLVDQRPLDPSTGKIGEPTKQTIKLDANGMADFAALGITLRPGDVYSVGDGKRTLIFKVDAFAVAAPLPVLIRLIRL